MSFLRTMNKRNSILLIRNFITASKPAFAKKGSSGSVHLSKVGTTIPINILKTGKDPVELDDKEYPEWLWKLTEPVKTIEEIERKGTDDLSLAEEGNYWRRVSRKYIKGRNFDAKMGVM